MKILTKKTSQIILLFITLFINPIEFLAQINPPNGCTFPGGCCPDGLPPSFCPGCPPCVPVPLNPELWFLIIAGLILGYYFLKKKKSVQSC
tara:strand:- start:2230 stop:2502 length:273 start_codon:yes stop_codon:yes gene_type:complete